MTKKDFIFLQSFNNHDEFEKYRLSIYRMAVESTRKLRCSKCNNNSGNHSMKIQYFSCSNSDCYINEKICNKKFKLTTCLAVRL